METEHSRQLIPRHIYLDFRENFGNYSSCFQGNQSESQSAAEVKDFGLWD